jgi:uncharacterized membrane protein
MDTRSAAPTSLSGKADPVVRPIVAADVVEALVRGLRDFQAAPGYGIALGAGCATVGTAVVATLYLLGMPYLAYPIAAGFALVCPFVAAILYEVSRRREAGLPLAASDVWRTVLGRSEVRWMGFATLFVLVMWMYQVRFLMAVLLGEAGFSASLEEFVRQVLTTEQGLVFLLIGNAIGAGLAALLFTITVVSFPLVLDRDVDFVTAMVTSVRAVAASPGPMLLYAAIIVVLLVLSTLTAFLGLLLTLPVLGHATWHLYRRAVAPAAPA